MSIKIAISHKTAYKFDRSVKLFPHIFRLRPAAHSRGGERDTGPSSGLRRGRNRGALAPGDCGGWRQRSRGRQHVRIPRQAQGGLD